MSCTWHLQPSPSVPPPPSASATACVTRNDSRTQRTKCQKQDLSTTSFSVTFDKLCPSPPLGATSRAAPGFQFNGTATPLDENPDHNEAPFEFPVEVERMVSELCSSSKESPPKYESFGLSMGISLDYGGLPGLHFNDSISAPPTTPVAAAPAKLRSPFSLLQVPQQVPPPLPVRAPEVQPLPLPTQPAFRFSEPSPIQADPYYPDSYPFSSTYSYSSKSSLPGATPARSILTELPLPDGDTSFRELVVKGCLELENILRVHKQHSYIGDLLTFCHAIRESAAAFAFDAPSEETRALIIAFFRLVSCWLGLFPCQQDQRDLHSAFREWQQASRRVIVAILRRVPVLQHMRERLLPERPDRECDLWRPQNQHPSPTSRQVWPKGQSGGKGVGKGVSKTLPHKGAAASCASDRGPGGKDWPELMRADGTRPGAGPGPTVPRSTTLPLPAWRAEDNSVDANQGDPRVSTRLGAPPAPGPSGPPPNLDSTFVGASTVPRAQGYPLPHSDSPSTQRPIGSAKASRWRSPAGPQGPQSPRTAQHAGRHHAQPVVRFDLDGSDEVHHGAYMKPGCYDVPMRQSTPPAAPVVLATSLAPALPLLPPGPPLLSETTWQAALASAETLSKALQSHEDAGPGREDGAGETAASGFLDEVRSYGVDSGDVPPVADPLAPDEWLPLAQAEVDEQRGLPTTPINIPVDECRSKDSSSKGKKGKSRTSSGSRVARVVGRSRSWSRCSRSVQSPAQPAQPSALVQASQLSPTTMRKAKDILGALSDLRKADDTEFEEEKEEGVSINLDAMSQKLESQAYETLEQFEQDFRQVLFNHANCSGDSAAVCAGRTRALEKVFNELLEQHFCRRERAPGSVLAPAVAMARAPPGRPWSPAARTTTGGEGEDTGKAQSQAKPSLMTAGSPAPAPIPVPTVAQPVLAVGEDATIQFEE